MKKLMDSYTQIKKDANISQVSHNAWINYFKGSGGEMEHVALIVLWLSRYVFSFSNVFSIAVNLAKGNRIALAAAILASIYRDLSLLKEKIASLKSEKCLDDGSKLVLWAPFQLVQVWFWERFPSLGPKPVSLDHGEPRLARWHGVKKSKTMSLMLDIESGGEEFMWRPYVLNVRNWEFPKFYCDREMWVLVNHELDEEHLSFARCLMVSELVGMNCVEQYLPHRVAMQFGMDQDIPIDVPRLNNNVGIAIAWSSYDKLLDGLKFYLPPRLLKGDVTVDYSRWWKAQSSFHVGVSTVSKMRRRRVRKVRKLSQILDESKPKLSSSPCNEGAGLAYSKNRTTMQDIANNMLLMLENDNENEANAIEEEEEEDKQKQEVKRREFDMTEDRKYSEINTNCQSEVLLCSSSQQNEVMHLDLFGCNSVMPWVKATSHEGIASQNLESEPIEILSGARAEHVQHKAVEDADAKQIKTSLEGIEIVSDEEQNVDCKPFEALVLDFEARIDKLDKIVSELKAYKSRSVVG